MLLYAVDSDKITAEDKAALLSVYQGESKDLDVDLIHRIYKYTGSLQKSIDKMEEFANLAGEILKDYPDCDARSSLLELLDQYNHNFTENLESIASHQNQSH